MDKGKNRRFAFIEYESQCSAAMARRRITSSVGMVLVNDSSSEKVWEMEGEWEAISDLYRRIAELEMKLDIIFYRSIYCGQNGITSHVV